MNEKLANLRDAMLILGALLCALGVGVLQADEQLDATGMPETDLALVVAPPWLKEAETLVLVSGGELIGPERAAFGLLARLPEGVDTDYLRENGVWAVWDGRMIAWLCGGILS